MFEKRGLFVFEKRIKDCGPLKFGEIGMKIQRLCEFFENAHKIVQKIRRLISKFWEIRRMSINRVQIK